MGSVVGLGEVAVVMKAAPHCLVVVVVVVFVVDAVVVLVVVLVLDIAFWLLIRENRENLNVDGAAVFDDVWNYDDDDDDGALA